MEGQPGGSEQHLRGSRANRRRLFAGIPDLGGPEPALTRGGYNPPIARVHTAAVVAQDAGRLLLRQEKSRPAWLADATIAVAVAAGAAVLVFHRLDVSLWFDETYSYGMATQPIASYFTHWVWGPESNMLLYYLSLRAWLGVLAAAGQAPVELLLRLPSAIFAIASSVMVFLLGRRLFGRAAGVVAASLFAANFLQMILAQNARSYSLQLLLLTASWLCMFIALSSGRRRWWVAYSVTIVLAVYAALFSGLVILAQVAGLVALLVLPGPWRDRVWRSRWPAVVSLAISFVFVLPLAVDVLLHGGPVWVPPATLTIIRIVVNLMIGDSKAYAILIFGGAALGVAMAAASYVPRLASITRATPETLGPAIAIAFVIPPLCLLAGLAVGSVKVRALQAVTALAVLAVAVPPLLSYYPVAEVQDFKTPVQWLQQHYRSGDGIVCYPEVQCAIPIDYYVTAYPGPAALDAGSPGAFYWTSNTSLTVDGGTIRAYESGHRRIFFIYAPLGRSPADDQAAGALEAGLTADGYHIVDQVRSSANSADTTILLFEAS
ncbi:MAG: glycosyltransferase family 39 protein [Chloroflexi bacterium]|nr:MAG: glycosyltransferase family 39 protein [Chloroflexota bacterium]